MSPEELEELETQVDSECNVQGGLGRARLQDTLGYQIAMLPVSLSKVRLDCRAAIADCYPLPLLQYSALIANTGKKPLPAEEVCSREGCQAGIDMARAGCSECSLAPFLFFFGC